MSIGGTTSGIQDRAIADIYTGPKSRSTGRRGIGVDKIILALVMLYLLIPLGATTHPKSSSLIGLSLTGAVCYARHRSGSRVTTRV